MTDLCVQFRLKISVVGVVVTGRRQRLGSAHRDLRSNRLTDYVCCDFESAENCTLCLRPLERQSPASHFTWSQPSAAFVPRSFQSRWRNVETRIRIVASHGGQIPGPAPEAAVAELVHASAKPYAELGLCRFLRGSHHHLPASVCFCVLRRGIPRTTGWLGIREILTAPRS